MPDEEPLDLSELSDVTIRNRRSAALRWGNVEDVELYASELRVRRIERALERTWHDDPTAPPMSHSEHERLMAALIACRDQAEVKRELLEAGAQASLLVDALKSRLAAGEGARDALQHTVQQSALVTAASA